MWIRDSLSVVHTRRPRQLLPVQWRPERRAAVAAPRLLDLADMSTSILITGAAGFAGGHLLDRLAREDAGIVAWHRPGGDPPRAAAGTRWQAIDLLDARSVRQTIAELRPKVVYHCAGAAHVG